MWSRSGPEALLRCPAPFITISVTFGDEPAYFSKFQLRGNSEPGILSCLYFFRSWFELEIRWLFELS